jgi:Ca2+-binding RTX toxin-like protein
MATYVSYSPTGPIDRAMFNFDVYDIPNYRLAGTVRVSVSDAFSITDYQDPNYSAFTAEIATADENEVPWTEAMVINIGEILGIFAQFAAIAFEWVGDFDSIGNDSTANPEDVGRADASDINITWLERDDVGFSGISGASSDELIYNYVGGAGDIFLNALTPDFEGDFSLGLNTSARQTLIHELGHSLGLSHPHSDYDLATGQPVVTADYAATRFLGFDQLGFRTATAQDMYKEYFSIMSYDDQQSLLPGFLGELHAHTPMILDVIALQQAYGEGPGTSGAGDDIIRAGNAGYRTYFDTGGTDTVDLALYEEGAYLNLGVTITGADYPVGVAMSLHDALNTVTNAGDPAHLRWLYGYFENALGSAFGDFLLGSAAGNRIGGLQGSDYLFGDAGNDTLEGGPGADNLGGGLGSDSLVGAEGNDVFDEEAWERAGIDTLQGGPGNDTYFVNKGDVIVELAAQGIDRVVAAVGWTLPAYVEQLQLGGTTAINGTGNAGANTLTGNAVANILTGLAGADTLSGGGGNDVLIGGGGNDSLTGGAGADQFMFGTLPTAGNVDRIADFSSGTDRIRLDDDVFTAFDAGVRTTLLPGQFFAGDAATQAHDTDDRIVYDTASGALYYDGDGLDGAASVRFAVLAAAPLLGAADFTIVG